MHKIAPKVFVCAAGCLAIAALFGSLNIGTAVADEIRTECNAVKKIASITRSSRLLLSVASDGGMQYCHFFVSAPPPFSIHRGAVEAWFKEASVKDPEKLVRIISDLVVIAVPEGNEQTVKEAQLRIGRNFDLISSCASKFLAKGPFSGRSDSGDVSCNVDKAADEATIVVAFGDFRSTLVLPRPV